MNSKRPPIKADGTYARGAGPTTKAPMYATAQVTPGTLEVVFSSLMPCAICVLLSEWYPTNPPPSPLTMLANPTAFSSSFASPSRSVLNSTALVMRRTPKTLSPKTATAPGAWSYTTSHLTWLNKVSGCRNKGSKLVPKRPEASGLATFTPLLPVRDRKPSPSELSKKNPNLRGWFGSGKGPSRYPRAMASYVETPKKFKTLK
mmetsp:Transcript_7727/g.28912  ORF Transcript_7727/g.28912 Transcript_7727/m.28912 type:complete len:203 (+) Transcript_7727:2126-2734(+)